MAFHSQETLLHFLVDSCLAPPCSPGTFLIHTSLFFGCTVGSTNMDTSFCMLIVCLDSLQVDDSQQKESTCQEVHSPM